MLHTPLLVMNRLNKTEFAIFISLTWSLLPKDLTNQNLFNRIYAIPVLLSITTNYDIPIFFFKTTGTVLRISE